ncbi:MAG: hypothetical protein LC734_09605 [Acidobacteria bacterium]|nr:hypothetical protein [Acidobacteriota bacterium]
MTEDVIAHPIETDERSVAAATVVTNSRYDRSIVEGPLGPAVWKIAWPTMLTNMIGGLQGIVDHVLVGNLVGFTGNAAIGVSWQIFLVVIVFISSIFTGMSVLVARFAGAGNEAKVNRTVYQAFLTAIFISFGIMAPVGYFSAPFLLDLVNAAPEVKAEALPFLRITFVFSQGMLIYFMLAGALRSAGDARTPMILGIAMTGLNLVLNVALISGIGPIPAFGTIGSAMGTSIASGLIAVYALWKLWSGGLMGAAATVAGQNLGAGNPERAQSAVGTAAWFGLIVATFVGFFFFFFPEQLLGLFGMTDPAVLDIGTQLLRVLSISGLFISTALVYTGGLQGTGDTKGPLYISIISQFLVPLTICFVLNRLGVLQPIHIWVAILAGHVTRCILSIIRFKQEKWRGIAVEIEQTEA